jgi:Tfp pilus assembly protein PilW
MDFQSHIKDPSPAPPQGSGFTLLEVMMGTLITAFVFAGVISSYIFLGRALSRQANAESLESRTRLALYYFTHDVSSAISIEAANPGSQTTGSLMTLTVPTSGGGTQLITYACDWSQGSAHGVLERKVGIGGTYLVLLTNLTSFQIQYFDPTTNPVTVPSSVPSSPQINIKQVCMSYTTSAGYAPSGNVSNYSVVSPLVIMKNKSTLVDPTSP